MAMRHGKGGSVTFTGADAVAIVSWSVDAVGEVADSSNMASANDWREFLAGMKSWTATVETNVTATVIAAIGTSATLSLLDGTETFSGTAICTGTSGSSGIDDVTKASYTFQGSGALGHA